MEKLTWNYLGWKDPFARASFTERQKRINAANRTSFVYTPELVLDGKIYRRELMGDDFPKKVQAVNRAAPQARLALAASPRKSELAVSVNVAVPASGHRATSEIYLVLTETRTAFAKALPESRPETLFDVPHSTCKAKVCIKGWVDRKNIMFNFMKVSY